MSLLCCRSRCQNFNPRSREGSDHADNLLPFVLYISIHAPARGATHNRGFVVRKTVISIHAPARGATNCSRPLPEWEEISIHAPARGATGFRPDHSVVFFRFQSTLPRGERPPCMEYFSYTWIFQSTLPRGERPCLISADSVCFQFQSTLPRGERRNLTISRQHWTAYFNPRSREGSDRVHLVSYSGSTISIHAPARGATL